MNYHWPNSQPCISSSVSLWHFLDNHLTSCRIPISPLFFLIGQSKVYSRVFSTLGSTLCNNEFLISRKCSFFNCNTQPHIGMNQYKTYSIHTRTPTFNIIIQYTYTDLEMAYRVFLPLAPIILR